MTRVIPDRNSIYVKEVREACISLQDLYLWFLHRGYLRLTSPNANRAASKKVTIPSMRNRSPADVMPTPILGDEQHGQQALAGLMKMDVLLLICEPHDC